MLAKLECKKLLLTLKTIALYQTYDAVSFAYELQSLLVTKKLQISL